MMINPSTEDNHIEAVHPQSNTVQEAIDFRRYGRPWRPKETEAWQPHQLS
ncbi:MAG TPA: hypothetical protein VMV86_02835 [Methanosarcinales archaeon]|nr:hypothetical protein [Methanosarcinales archaeon]